MSLRAKSDGCPGLLLPDILMAPFYDTSSERRIKLPYGNWYDFYTGKLAGNDEVNVLIDRALETNGII